MASRAPRESLPKQLSALPVQFIETDQGAILRRGRSEFTVGSRAAADAIRLILHTTANQTASPQDIFQQFNRKSLPAVKRLLLQLLDWQLLVPQDGMQPAPDSESSLDIFYWELGLRTAQVIDALDQSRIVILGINQIARQLSSALVSSGVRTHKIVDYPLLRNLRLFGEGGTVKNAEWPDALPKPLAWTGSLAPIETGCLVVTSDFGWSPMFEECNRLCISRKCFFIPVTLEDQIGRVGPLIVPGETACYACLQARINSHLENPEHRRAVEKSAFAGQGVNGFHPSMASVLGDLAALELTKFLSGTLPRPNAGFLIEIDLFEPRLTTRKVLRVPRCPECSPMNVRASTNPEKTEFTPSGWAGE